MNPTKVTKVLKTIAVTSIAVIAGIAVGYMVLVTPTAFAHDDEPTLEQLCHNTIDDDHDGFIDLLDSDCAQFIPICTEGEHAGPDLLCVPNDPEDPICVAPQQLVEHVCTDPEPPPVVDLCPEEGVQTELPCAIPPIECVEPQVLVDNECVDPTPVDPDCTETQHLVEHECVDNPTEPPSQGNPPFSGGGGGGGPLGGGPLWQPTVPLGGPSGGGPVVGAPTACSPLLTSYLRLGRHNPADQVDKLEVFLNGNLGLSLPIDGLFDQETEDAVKAFQAKYSDEVLSPWYLFGGHIDPTGIVYITTRRHINKLYCATVNEPLPPLQVWHD